VREDKHYCTHFVSSTVVLYLISYHNEDAFPERGTGRHAH